MPALTPGSTVLVTGASGWVGGHVCAYLISKGYVVRAAVRDPSAERVQFLTKMGCELVRVPDLLADDGWAEAMNGCDGLAHVASPVDLSGTADEATMVAMAVDGTERAMRFAAEARSVKRVVVTATMASVCGSQRDSNPDHLWSEADKNDAPGSAYSKSKTAAEAKVWELAEMYKDRYAVSTIHPAVVLGKLLDGQPPTSTIGLMLGLCKGKVVTSMFGVCDAIDTAAMHLAALEKEEAAGQRYLICGTDQHSTLELAEWAVAAGATIDLAAWKADEGVQKMSPKKPSTDNRKALALLGRELVAPAKSVELAVASLKAQGHL